MLFCLQALVSDIDMMKRRVSRLLILSACLQYSGYGDIGVQQTDQLTAMSSELDAMRLTCIDRMLLSDRDVPAQRAVCYYSLALNSLSYQQRPLFSTAHRILSQATECILPRKQLSHRIHVFRGNSPISGAKFFKTSALFGRLLPATSPEM